MPEKLDWLKLLVELLKGLVESLPKHQRTPALASVVLAVICISYGFIGPDPNHGLVFKNLGFVTFLSVLFYVSFHYSSKKLRDSGAYVRAGLASSGIAAVMGACLYSLSDSAAVPHEPPSTYTTILLEKFGRFVFFLYPIGFGFALVMAGFMHMRRFPRKTKALAPSRHEMGAEVAVLTILLSIILVVLVALISLNIMELGLAKAGQPMGPIDPVRHMVFSFMLFVTGVTALSILRQRRAELARRVTSALGMFVCLGTISFMVAIVLCQATPSLQLPPGTGIGVLVSILAFALSVISLSVGLLVHYDDNEKAA